MHRNELAVVGFSYGMVNVAAFDLPTERSVPRRDENKSEYSQRLASSIRFSESLSKLEVLSWWDLVELGNSYSYMFPRCWLKLSP